MDSRKSIVQGVGIGAVGVENESTICACKAACVADNPVICTERERGDACAIGTLRVRRAIGDVDVSGKRAEAETQ